MPSLETIHRAVCLDLFCFEYLLAHHLAYHLPTVAPKNRPRVANRYLAAMEGQRLVRRFTLPAMRGQRGGSAPKVATLGEVGAHLVSEELGIDLAKTRWKPMRRETNLWFLAHTLAVADYAFTLRHACRRAGYDVGWIGEAELKRSDPITVTVAVNKPAGDEAAEVQEQPLKLVPDGVYTIGGSERRQASYLLELDRGTVTINSQSPLQRQGLMKKIAGYQAFISGGLHTTVFGMRTPPRVTWVTTSDKRMASLKTAVQETVSQQWQHVHWFTTQARATEDAVLTQPIWSVAGKDGRFQLFKQGGE